VRQVSDLEQLKLLPLWPETIAAIKVVLEQRLQEQPLLFIAPRDVNYIGRNKGYRIHQGFVRGISTLQLQCLPLRRPWQRLGRIPFSRQPRHQR
jgi:hypothetical protein